MPNFRKNHEDCLKETCVSCGKKVDPKRQLSKNHIDHLKTIYPQYDAHKRILPTGICEACRKKFFKLTAENLGFINSIIEELLALPPIPRGSNCSCSLCNVVRQKGRPSKQVSKPAAPTEPAAPPAPPILDPDPDLAEPQPSTSTPSFAEIMRTPLEVREQVISATLKEKTGGKSGEVQVKTFGRPLTVHVGAIPKTKAPQISVARLEQLQAEKNLSNSQTLAVGAMVRNEFGRKSIEPHLQKTLVEKPKEIAPFFSLVDMDFYVPGGKIESRKAVICTNLRGFLGVVLAKKNIQFQDENWFPRINVDDGGPESSGSNSFKVSLSIVITEPSSPALSPPSKKGPATAFPFPSSSKSTGEKQALILAVVSNITEHYDNVKKIFEHLDWSALPRVRFTQDLKINNVCNGQQNHASSFPCNYCTWQYSGFSRMKKGVKANLKLYLRTIGNQKALAEQYNNATGAAKDPQRFYSTHKPPLLPGENSKFILQVCPPPELHLMEGVVNHFVTEMNKHLGENGTKLTDFLKSNSVLKVYQQNFKFQGNQCSDILNFLLPELKCFLPPSLHKYLNVMEKLKNVKDSCFGMILRPDYKQCISDFKAAFIASGWTTFSKAHIIMEHVETFCKNENKSLGWFSEQCGESVHKGFANIYERYKLNAVNDKHQESFLAAVLKYNTLHM